jgi:hypothetical protein
MLDKKTSISTIINCIQSVKAFMKLGIVNPRFVPAGLIARYILSAPLAVEDEGDDLVQLNTVDLNLLAIDGLDVENLKSILPKTIQFVLKSSAHDARTIHQAVSEVYRAVEYLFSTHPANSDAKDRRYACEYFVSLLGENGDDFFITAVIIIGCTVCGSEESLTKISSEVSPFIQQFIFQNVHKLLSDGIGDRFDCIGKLWADFKERVVLDDELHTPNVSTGIGRKRSIKSTAMRRVSRVVKRRRMNNEGSSDDEYIAGRTSSDDDESFETCFED